MNMIAIRILATFSTMMCDVSGLADLLILDIERKDLLYVMGASVSSLSHKKIN